MGGSHSIPTDEWMNFVPRNFIVIVDMKEATRKRVIRDVSRLEDKSLGVLHEWQTPLSFESLILIIFVDENDLVF